MLSRALAVEPYPSLCWHFLDIQSKHERASDLSKDLISGETFIRELGSGNALVVQKKQGPRFKP